jgi:hypothetical protein
MNGINKELSNAINQEVSDKEALVAAKKICEDRRPRTRLAIEDILAAKQLEASLELSL